MHQQQIKPNLPATHHVQAIIGRLGRRGLVVACLVTPMLSVGCRSGKPGWNLFGSRGEPSAEMLAGSGPTLTYPTPPSSNATPQAIASIAGGTSSPTPNAPTTPSMGGPGMGPGSMPSNMAAPGGSSPYALASNQTAPPAYAMPGSPPPAKTPSHAAAAANGYAAGGTPIAPNSLAATPTTQTQLPTGYQLGGASPALGNQMQQGKDALAANQTSLTNQVNAKTSEVEAKANSFALPAMNSLTPSRLAGGQSTPAPSNSYGNGGGFTLPSGIVAGGVAASTAKPTPTPGTPQPASTSMDAGTALAALGSLPSQTKPSAGLSTPLPSAIDSTPSAQTASAPTGGTSQQSSQSLMGFPGGSTNVSGSVQPTGYMPGSTGASSGYPVAPSMIR